MFKPTDTTARLRVKNKACHAASKLRDELDPTTIQLRGNWAKPEASHVLLAFLHVPT
jgi:hypothetical protein